MAPTLDRLLFSRQSTQWCFHLAPEPSLWGSCERFDPFVYDDITIWLLALAAVSFWYRRIPRLPAATTRILAALLYWALEEEIRFQPYSVFLTEASDGSFSLHTQFGALNASLYIILLVMLLAFACIKVRFWSRRKRRSITEAGVGSRQGVVLSIENANFVYGLGILAAVLSSMVLTSVFATEHDKYRDFLQSIVYLTLFLYSLESPVRDETAESSGRWTRYLVLIALLPVFVAGDILMR